MRNSKFQMLDNPKCGNPKFQIRKQNAPRMSTEGTRTRNQCFSRVFPWTADLMIFQRPDGGYTGY
jgi:hypothetical protein